MSEYSKKTVAELQSLLKARGITATGKKADLVARLVESDDSSAAADTTTAETVAETAQPIATTTTQPDPAASSNNDQSTSAQDTAQPQQAADEAPAAEPQSFAANLAASNLDAEMEKRRKRAERFNTGAPAAEDTMTPSVDAEAQKSLERAKKFGTESEAINKLDQALSTEREGGRRGRGKGATVEESVLDDPGLKRGFGRSRGRGQGRRRDTPDRPSGVQKPAVASDRDRIAAEARKKRFATAAS